MELLKVVIIDDENIIVEGLRRVVAWEKYGCEVAATAGNAEEGAQVIRKVRPDILFTDIKMPDQDGLSLLAGLRSEFPKMQVTVLTGHREFDYAQKAIRLGVSRFLLKPSKMDEIDEALKYMTETIRQERPAPEPPQEEDDSAAGFVVRQALLYIRKHYNEKLCLMDVAAHCFVSQWHLSKLLHKNLDKNFYEIINEMRILKAKEFLRDPGLTVAAVCDMVGYNDPAHFSKVFKRMEGISANEYRAQIVNKP
jgi:YesN/AraC family two-component response regulator